MLDTSHLSGSFERNHSNAAGNVFDFNSSHLMALGRRSNFNRMSQQDSKFAAHLDLHTVKLSKSTKVHLNQSHQALIPERFRLSDAHAKPLSHHAAPEFGFGVLTMSQTQASHDDLLGDNPKLGIQRGLTSIGAIETPVAVPRAKLPSITVDLSEPTISVGKARAPVASIGNEPTDPTPITVTRVKPPALTVDPSEPTISVGRARAPVASIGNEPTDPTPITVTRVKPPALTVDPSEPTISVGKVRAPVASIGNEPTDPTPITVTRVKPPALTVDPSEPTISVGKVRAPAASIGNEPLDPTPVAVTRARPPAITVDPSEPTISVGKVRAPAVPIGNSI